MLLGCDQGGKTDDNRHERKVTTAQIPKHSSQHCLKHWRLLVEGKYFQQDQCDKHKWNPKEQMKLRFCTYAAGKQKDKVESVITSSKRS